VKDQKNRVETLLRSLHERARELECFYGVQSMLSTPNITLEVMCRKLLEIIPPGWRYPELCVVKVSVGTTTCTSPDFVETQWMLCSDIVVQGRVVGFVAVYYTSDPTPHCASPFLDEEVRLLDMIASRVGDLLLQRIKTQFAADWNEVRASVPEYAKCEWQMALGAMKSADPDLYQRVARKMLNYLCWNVLTSLVNGIARARSTAPTPRRASDRVYLQWPPTISNARTSCTSFRCGYRRTSRASLFS